MEDLTKTQIILLTLLLNFVTSIAVGIITVSLLSEAPTSITQTINRVVERTIQTVIPGEKPKVETVLNESDLIVTAIEKGEKSLIRVKASDNSGTTLLGVIMSKDGIVALDKNAVNTDSYKGILFDDREVLLSQIHSSSTERFAFFKIGGQDMQDSSDIVPADLSASQTLKLGQTVISLSGTNRITAGVGRISDIVYKLPVGEIGTTTAKMSKELEKISTDISDKGGVSGGIILDIQGKLLGVKIPNIFGPASGDYVSVFELKKELALFLSAQ